MPTLRELLHGTNSTEAGNSHLFDTIRKQMVHRQLDGEPNCPYFGIEFLISVFLRFGKTKNRCNSFERQRLYRIAGGGFEPPTSGL